MDGGTFIGRRALATALMSLALVGATRADPVEDFYRGKTLTVLVGVGAGGEYDFQTRLVARHIGRHIPGNPATVAQNMVGATGLLMANHLYNLAPKDGTVIGLIQNGLPSFQAMGIPGVNFNAAKFNWIGSISPTVETMATWKGSGARTIEDARKKTLIAGANGRSGITYTFPKLLNELLDTKFNIARGGIGEGGEADARNNSWTSWKTSKNDWIVNKNISIIVYAGPRPADLDGAPSIEELTKNDEDRQLARLVTSGSLLGHPFATAPGVPAERVKALRDAFSAMLKDPEFIKDVVAARLEIDEVTGESLQRTVDELMAMPAAVRERGRKLVD